MAVPFLERVCSIRSSAAFPWKGISAAHLQSPSPAGFVGRGSEGGDAEGAAPPPWHMHSPHICKPAFPITHSWRSCLFFPSPAVCFAEVGAGAVTPPSRHVPKDRPGAPPQIGHLVSVG